MNNPYRYWNEVSAGYGASVPGVVNFGDGGPNDWSEEKMRPPHTLPHDGGRAMSCTAGNRRAVYV
jgi:hypothetical protein